MLAGSTRPTVAIDSPNLFLSLPALPLPQNSSSPSLVVSAILYQTPPLSPPTAAAVLSVSAEVFSSWQPAPIRNLTGGGLQMRFPRFVSVNVSSSVSDACVWWNGSGWDPSGACWRKAMCVSILSFTAGCRRVSSLAEATWCECSHATLFSVGLLRTGCDGIVNSMAQFDRCNVCNGSNACVGCDGIPFSNKVAACISFPWSQPVRADPRRLWRVWGRRENMSRVRRGERKCEEI